MPDPFEFFELPPDVAERRIHARQPVRAIGYVQLDESNGGIILNINEGGFAVFAVAGLIDDHLPHIRFQIPQSNEWIETSGNVIWRSESKKLAGVRFSDLSEHARGQIREWCYSQAPPDVPFEASEDEIAPLRVPFKARSEAHPGAPSQAHSEKANSIFSAVAALDPAAQALDPPAPVLELVNLVPEPPPLVLEPAAPLSASSPAPADPPVIRPINVNASRERTLSYPASPDAGLPAASSAGRKPRKVTAPKTAHSAAAADRMPLQQPVSPASNVGGWIFFAALCLVLSVAVGWAAERGTLRPLFLRFFPQNHSAISETVAKPVPQQDSSLPPAASPAANPPLSQLASPVSPADAGQLGIPPAVSNLAAAPDTSPPASRNLAAGRRNATAAFGPVVLTPPVRSQSTRAIPNPVEPGILNYAPPLPAVFASANLDPTPPPEPSSHPRPGQLIHHVAASYPPAALASRIEGTVTLRAAIGVNGEVTHVQPLSGPPALVSAAVDAVRQWRYKPAKLDGQPVETQEDIAIAFRLSPTD